MLILFTKNLFLQRERRDPLFKRVLLQPVQYDDKANDSGRGQRRAVNG